MDIQKYLDSRTELTNQSIKVYRNSYDRLKALLKPRAAFNQKNILSALSNYDGDKTSLLVVSILLLKHHNKPVKRLEDMKKTLQDERDAKSKQTNRDRLDSTITYDQLMTLPSLAKTDQEYVIWKLLLDFNTRNKDLIIKHLDEPNDTDNSMVVFGDTVIYTRCDYKTKSKYGTKTHRITDPRIVEFVKTIPMDECLIKTNRGNPVKSDCMSKYIAQLGNRHYPDSNITQQIIYKILKLHADETNDLRMTEEMSSNRGHSMEVAAQYYRS